MGFIDLQGNVIIPFQFDNAQSFSAELPGFAIPNLDASG